MAYRKQTEEKKPKPGAFKPKLQDKIDELKETGMTDASVLKALQALGHKHVLREIQYWTDRHNWKGDA